MFEMMDFGHLGNTIPLSDGFLDFRRAPGAIERTLDVGMGAVDRWCGIFLHHTRATERKHEFSRETHWQHRMEQLARRNHTAFYHPEIVPGEKFVERWGCDDGRVAHRIGPVFVPIGIQRREIHILDFFPAETSVVQDRRVGTPTIKRVSRKKRHVPLRPQGIGNHVHVVAVRAVGVPHVVEITRPHVDYRVARLQPGLFLMQPRVVVFGAFGKTPGTPVIVAGVELIDGVCDEIVAIGKQSRALETASVACVMDGQLVVVGHQPGQPFDGLFRVRRDVLFDVGDLIARKKLVFEGRHRGTGDGHVGEGIDT